MEPAVSASDGMPEVRYPPGTVLIREGDRTNELFVLLGGTVAVFKGEVRITRVRSAGALFGEMSILLDLPCSATVVADTEVLVRRIADGAGFLASTPQVALYTARLLAQRLHDTTTYLADLKSQFEDSTDHFGMVDRIISALLNQQADAPMARPAARTDPRL